MKKRVYCYVRFSSKKQELGDSIERQQRLIDRYLVENNAEIVEKFSDLGVSAFRGKNVKAGALSKFLDRVSDGEISHGDTLIVESLDRISRQKELNTLSILTAILNAGVIIYTLADGRIYNAHSEDHAQLLFQIGFIISRAYDESLTKQKRSVSAWEKKHENARTGKALMTRKLPYWLKVSEDGRTIEVIEERAREVKKAFELAKLKLGAQSIAARLNKEEAQKRWTLIAVRHLLSSKSVYGSLELYKTKSLAGQLENNQAYEEIEGYFPAVIGKEEYYGVQETIQKNKETFAVRGRTPKGFRNVFKGLIKCLDCGSFLHQNFLKRKGNEYMYLVCHKSLVGACLSGKKVIIPYRHILEPFLLFFMNYGVEKMLPATAGEQDIKQKIAALRNERKNKQESLDRLSSEVEKNNGVLPKTILKLIEKIESQLTELEFEENKALARLDDLGNVEAMKGEIDRSKLDEILSTEEGRLKFNSLLTSAGIEVLVSRNHDEEYSSMYIMFKNKGFSENIRFNRREALIPLMGVYNFNKRTYERFCDDDHKSIEQIEYSQFKIDWTL